MSDAKVSGPWPLSLPAVALGTSISRSHLSSHPVLGWNTGGRQEGIRSVYTGLAQELPGTGCEGLKTHADLHIWYIFRGKLLKRRGREDANVTPMHICTHAHGRVLSRSFNTWFFQAPRSSSPPLPEESLNPNFIILVPIKFFFFPKLNLCSPACL